MRHGGAAGKTLERASPLQRWLSEAAVRVMPMINNYLRRADARTES